MSGKTAYITGGASGIALAVAEMLVGRGVRVCIADRNLEGAKAAAEKLGKGAIAVEVNTPDWDSQLAAFEKAVKEFGRIDYVFPIAGIGERKTVKRDGSTSGFQKPDLSTLDVDLVGVLYTAYLAIQQMRRQEKDSSGFRGKIAATASACGIYCIPTIPIYTAAKRGVVGFVRSYGKYLPEENITLNAVCPNVVKTHISSDAFYDRIESENLMTPMKGVIDSFESFLDSDISGECLEQGPNGGFVRRAPEPFLDEESERAMQMVYDRSYPLHQPE